MGDLAQRWEAVLAGRNRAAGWIARYVKEVDAEEATVRFYQEIYDASWRLVEVHYKYPEDEGHRKA